MTHAVGKDQDGRYWFRSRQKLVDVTKACEFYVKKVLTKKARWFWQKNQYEWHVYSKTLFKKGYFRYPSIKQDWIDDQHTHELLGVYQDEDDAATALECLMHMRDVELIMF